ncbi:DUF4267 domain-containing protein [uncultured Chitinophaga sp.]|jgi:hypothetical protein|uniref:DUF4267 domain-containing protein n=1 Tax=uncultured Chitinophaga sp. TaxID=339340 RepID=UPI00262EDE6D|nr:DUF4267 domain-containing protein [uncultured Chitinophaga sp.]
MTTTFRSVTWWLTFISGLMLIFIGLRFFLVPEAAATAFGIQLDTRSDFSFHYIKAIRDTFSGLLFIALLLMKEWRALGITLLLGSIVPSVDMSIVISHPDYEPARIYPHLSAIILCIGLGIAFLRRGK